MSDGIGFAIWGQQKGPQGSNIKMTLMQVYGD